MLAYFRGTGPGWQTRINEALRRVLKADEKDIVAEVAAATKRAAKKAAKHPAPAKKRYLKAKEAPSRPQRQRENAHEEALTHTDKSEGGKQCDASRSTW